MADDDFVLAVHKETGLIQLVPRTYLEIYPFKELTEAQLTKARKEEETKVYGAPLDKLVTKEDVAAAVAPVQEGTTN